MLFLLPFPGLMSPVKAHYINKDIELNIYLTTERYDQHTGCVLFIRNMNYSPDDVKVGDRSRQDRDESLAGLNVLKERTVRFDSLGLNRHGIESKTTKMYWRQMWCFCKNSHEKHVTAGKWLRH